MAQEESKNVNLIETVNTKDSKKYYELISSEHGRLNHMISLKRLRPGFTRVFADKEMVIQNSGEDFEEKGKALSKKSTKKLKK